jgi:hypothetical protein
VKRKQLFENLPAINPCFDCGNDGTDLDEPLRLIDEEEDDSGTGFRVKCGRRSCHATLPARPTPNDAILFWNSVEVVPPSADLI